MADFKIGDRATSRAEKSEGVVISIMQRIGVEPHISILLDDGYHQASGPSSLFEHIPEVLKPTDEEIYNAIYGLGPDATSASRIWLVRRLFAKYQPSPGLLKVTHLD